MSSDPANFGEEKGMLRAMVLVVMLALVTVLLYQVIDGAQRQASARRRELRRQQWREWREQNERVLFEAASTQPEPSADREKQTETAPAATRTGN